jgi:branched-chain amino acid transport system substrate-binding protein
MTLQQAGQGAIEDIAAYKAAIDGFSVKNPFLEEDQQLTYVGSKDFEQKRQIGVPMVVNEVKDGEFKTLFIGSVE